MATIKIAFLLLAIAAVTFSADQKESEKMETSKTVGLGYYQHAIHPYYDGYLGYPGYAGYPYATYPYSAYHNGYGYGGYHPYAYYH